MLVDVHAHAYALSESELKELIGKVVVVSNGENWDTSLQCIQLSQKFPNIFAAVGFHPAFAEEYRDISPLLREEKVVAIGEIGLDGKIDVDFQVQQKVFEDQLRLAEQFGAPVIIHSRRAHAQVLEILPSYNVTFDLHWFSGPISLVVKAIDMGAFFSIGPYALRSKYYTALLSEVPMDRLLTETDTPVPIGGRRNTPLRVEEAVRAIADVKKMSVQEVIEAVQENFKRFVGTWKSSLPSQLGSS